MIRKLQSIMVLSVSSLAFIHNASGIELKDFDLAATKGDRSTYNIDEKASKVQKKYKKHRSQQQFMWSRSSTSEAATTQVETSKSTPSRRGKMAKQYLKQYFPDAAHMAEGSAEGGVKEGEPNTAADVKNKGSQVSIVSNSHSEFGPSIVKFRQQFDGVEIFGQEATVLMNAKQELVAVSGRMHEAKPIVDVDISSAGESLARSALLRAYEDMGLEVKVRAALSNSSSEKSANDYTEYSVEIVTDTHTLRGDINPRIKRMWYDDDGVLIPACYLEVSAIEVETGERSLFAYIIADDLEGVEHSRVLLRKDLRAHVSARYTTFANADGDPLGGHFHGPVIRPYPLVGLSPEEALEKFPFNFQEGSIQDITIDHGPVSTGDPWLSPVGPGEELLTVGQNVRSFVDISPTFGKDGPDYFVPATGPRRFDWQYDPEKPRSIQSRNAAAVNLFYINSWLNNYFYDLGFDEASGNAQQNNFGRGGEGNDPIMAAAQGAFRLNNASMHTPGDGRSPHMTMNMWEPKVEQGVDYDVVFSYFGDEFSVRANVSYIGPNGFPSIQNSEMAAIILNNECEIAQGSLEQAAGKVVVVILGRACKALDSLRAIQQKGATAVLVSRSASEGERLDGSIRSLYEPDPFDQVDIGNLVIANDIGEFVADTVINFPEDEITVSLFRNAKPLIDSSIDNAIVIHEWAHYMTNRLVGDGVGLSNPQGIAMGEGWSDFFAIYFAIEEQHRNIPGNENFQGIYTIGGWVVRDAYFGLRRVPYTTDMSKNAVTFHNISSDVPFEFEHPIQENSAGNAEVHNAGSMWTVALLEAYVALLNDSDRLSFDEAKKRMAYYLVGGLKLTPSRPTYTEARDAILAVAYAVDPLDHSLMKRAFAKRGLGVKAVSPSRFSLDLNGAENSFESDIKAVAIESVENVVEVDYENLNSAVEDDIFLRGSRIKAQRSLCAKDSILDNFEYGQLHIGLKNTGDLPLENIELKVETNLGNRIFLLNQGRLKVSDIPIDRNEIKVVKFPYFLNAALDAQRVEFTVSVVSDDAQLEIPEPATIFDHVNYDLSPKQDLHDDFEDALESFADWSTEIARPGPFSLDSDRIDELNNFFQIVKSADGSNSAAFVDARHDLFTDLRIMSPVVAVSETEDFAISFKASWSYFNELRNGVLQYPDGLTIEMKVGDDKWYDLRVKGGVFEETSFTGFTRTPKSALFRRAVYGGTNANGHLGETVRVKFAKELAGEIVQFRLRQANSSNGLESEGFFFDDFRFEGVDAAVFSKTEKHIRNCSNERFRR